MKVREKGEGVVVSDCGGRVL